MATPFNTGPIIAAANIKYDYIKPVVVEVGPGKIQFILKEAILCNSTYFRQACSEQSAANAVYKVLSVPNVTHEAFKIYVDWLRDMRIVISQEVYNGDEDNTTRAVQNVYDEETRPDMIKADLSLLVAAYEFGHQIADEVFGNAIIDRVMHIVQTTKYTLPLRFAETLWQLVADKSKMAELLEHYKAAHGAPVMAHGEPDDEDSRPTYFQLQIARQRLAQRHLKVPPIIPHEEDGYYHD